jgi:uncharacterized protein YebE (UPF0316 family)
MGKYPLAHSDCIDGELNLEHWFTTTTLLNALLIFALRVCDMSLDTVRVLFVMRGRKGIAWVIGFVQSAVFLIAFAAALKNIDNPLSFLGYAAGFATGNVVGIWMEEKMAIGYTYLRIISMRFGSKIAEQLRAEGYAVTEISGRGKDGMVNILNCSILRRHTTHAIQIVEDIDPEAFVTSQDTSAIQRGFWRA